ncbi:TPA: hypothetical protein N3J09_000915 [Salmonella enterica subsp. enterica serovar Panama]|nr:hypothetical protein [Salmonella enterica subsp. enterica serovar Panama]
MRSKRFEALAKRPVNQDGFVKEWIEEGFIAMESPNDPKPDAPRDKCAHFREINGIAAAFQYLQKNYNPTVLFLL